MCIICEPSIKIKTNVGQINFVQGITYCFVFFVFFFSMKEKNLNCIRAK